MAVAAKITTRQDPAGWVAEVVTLEFNRCVFSTEPTAQEIDAIWQARDWVRTQIYPIDVAPKGGVTVDLLNLAQPFDLQDFDCRR